MLWISVVETLVIIILCFLLIKLLDTEGVAWALVTGFLVEKILIIVFLKRQYGIDFQNYTHVKLYVCYSVLLLLSYVIQLF